jgi:hypothetical protein
MEKSMTNAEFNELVKKMRIVPVDYSVRLALEGTSPVDEALEHLRQYWQVAKPILKSAKLITPPKVDKAINEILTIVGKLCSSPGEQEKSELLQRFEKVWRIAKPVLKASKEITGKKADQVIDEVIKIGDLLGKVPNPTMELHSLTV